MAVVRLSDLKIPQVWDSYGEVNSPELTAFLTSGIVATDPVLDAHAKGPSNTGTMPYWLDLDATIEPNYSNDDPADVAVPNKISTDQLAYRKAYLNNGWSSADLNVQLIGEDPILQIKKRTSTYWLRALQRRVVAIARGVLAKNILSNASDMVIDISTQDGNNATVNNRFNATAFINAVFTLGDAGNKFVAIAVHSLVMSQMLKNDEIAFDRDSQGQLTIPRYKGVLVVVDDGMPVIAGTTSGFRYVSALFGPGFIGMGVGTPRTPVEVDRVAAAGSGEGIETFWERKSWLLHPAGHDWVEGTLTELSPTVADLALASHWTRKYTRKLTPIAFLITN
jgi:hypothetical protein